MVRLEAHESRQRGSTMAENIVDQLPKNREDVIPKPARLLVVAWVEIDEAVDHLPDDPLPLPARDAGNQWSNLNETASLASVRIGTRDRRTRRRGGDSRGQ